MADKKDYELENAIDENMTLDDIEDLPGFNVYPTGAYRVCLPDGITFKDINDKPAAEVKMVLEEVMEIADGALDDDEKPPMVGDICSLAFFRDNKIGAFQLKSFMIPLSQSLGTKRIGDIIQQCKDMKLLVIMNRVNDKNDDSKKYPRVKKVAVL